MILFESEYMEVLWHKKEHIVAGIWKDTRITGLTDAEFRENMLAWFEEVKKISNTNVLADARLFLLPIVPETQAWVNENIIGLYPSYGVAKLGFLVSIDLFSQVSIEQTMEDRKQAFQVRYFENEAEAIAWLAK
jgi:hypothetical protein